MDPLLQEIIMLPGVLGCFVFNGKQQIAGSKMPSSFKESNTKAIGNLLARTAQIGAMAQLSLKEIEIRYNEFLLMSKPLPKESLLIIICEPDANKSLISITIGMLAEDIAKALENPQAFQAKPGKPSPGTQKQQAPVEEKEAEISEELSPVLEQVRDALAMAIGPVAGSIMKDIIEIWAKQAPPSLTTIPALAELLCPEIDDDGLEEEFMTAIKEITG